MEGGGWTLPWHVYVIVCVWKVWQEQPWDHSSVSHLGSTPSGPTTTFLTASCLWLLFIFGIESRPLLLLWTQAEWIKMAEKGTHSDRATEMFVLAARPSLREWSHAHISAKPKCGAGSQQTYQSANVNRNGFSSYPGTHGMIVCLFTL